MTVLMSQALVLERLTIIRCCRGPLEDISHLLKDELAIPGHILGSGSVGHILAVEDPANGIARLDGD